MKLALIGPVYPYRGGIAHHTTRLAQTLAEHHAVRVISFRRQYPRWLYPGQSDQDPSQHSMRFPADYILDPFYPWTWWQCVQTLIQFAPDAVVVQWWIPFWGLAFAVVTRLLQRTSLRVIFIIHNVLPHEPRWWDVWLARLVLQQGGAFVVQSARERTRLLTLLPHAEVQLCPLPVFDIFVGQRWAKLEARRHLQLPETTPVVLFFGLVRPYKGLKYLIEALAHLRDQGYGHSLVVAGEFWENPAVYKAQIQQLGLNEQVRLLPYYIPNEEVGLIFSAADMLVAPYETATQSGVIKLALGFGLPVITTRVGGSEELEAWVEAGWVQLVAPKDSMALAIAMVERWQMDWPAQGKVADPVTQDWGHLGATIEDLLTRTLPRHKQRHR